MKTIKDFDHRFATDDQHHSFTLTADGCMNRMKDDSAFRELELNTQVERFARGAEADERQIMNYVAILASHGKQPMGSETVESFIIRNMNILSQYI